MMWFVVFPSSNPKSNNNQQEKPEDISLQDVSCRIESPLSLPPMDCLPTEATGDREESQGPSVNNRLKPNYSKSGLRKGSPECEVCSNLSCCGNSDPISYNSDQWLSSCERLRETYQTTPMSILTSPLRELTHLVDMVCLDDLAGDSE